jgi:hypothetical protein
MLKYAANVQDITETTPSKVETAGSRPKVISNSGWPTLRFTSGSTILCSKSALSVRMVTMTNLAQSFWFMTDAGAINALSATKSAPVIQIRTSLAEIARDRSTNCPDAL